MKLETLKRQLSEQVPGFSVSPKRILSNFTFLYYPMVVDLQRIAAKGTEHPLLSALAGVQSAMTGLESIGDESSLEELSIQDPYKEHLVFPADASQHIAISAIMGGKTVVIQGPPGTGKSQTIANVIAECAANSKSVLFVAEKRAAIDAVAERLHAQGLGDIVLDLHGEPDKKIIAKQLLNVTQIRTSNRRADHIELQKLMKEKDVLQKRWQWLNSDSGITIGREPMTVHDLLCEVGERSKDISKDDLAGISLDRISRLSWIDHNQVLDQIRTLIICEYFLSASANDNYLHLLGAVTTQNDVQQICEASDTLVSNIDSRPLLAASNLASRIAGMNPDSLRELQQLTSKISKIFILSSRWDLEHSHEIRNSLVAFGPIKAYRVARKLGIFKAFSERKQEIERISSYLKVPEVSESKLAKLSDIQAFELDISAWDELQTDVADLFKSESTFRLLPETLAAIQSATETVTGFGYPIDGEKVTISELSNISTALVEQRSHIRNLPRIHEAREVLNGFNVLEQVDELGLNLGAEFDFAQVWDFAWFTAHLQRNLNEDYRPEFGGQYLSESMRQFHDRDRLQLNKNPERVLFGIQQSLGNTNSEQFKFLRHQAELKTRHKPLRELLSRAPKEILRLKPCFAMSPLAVSRLLPSIENLFDVVIFDEASQVRPEHAITSIYRGKQLVIAGDEHQLAPPNDMTTTSTNTDEDSNLLTQDVESLLKVGMAVLPRKNIKPLSIHYRSNDERLISWSNFHIYKPNRVELFTFPSVESTSSTALRHTYLPNVRTQSMEVPNPAEISVVQELVLKHIDETPHLSLGVIAFGSRHANRLQDSFNALERDNEDFYLWKSKMDEGRERFFVKNIERVQGDERDAIIISPGYAPNLEGTLPMRFGSLNREGGERRINVAASRAKQYMHVVTSMRSSDFDVKRSASNGVALLKSFIEFMENDGRLVESQEGFGRPETPFEEQILHALEGEGLLVDCQVGASNYRLDFAVRHPETNQYILAVEADGAAYHSSAYARERDWLRQEVLEAKGWTFARIWSTDWWENPQREIDKVTNVYRSLLERLSAEASMKSRNVSRTVDDLTTLNPSSSSPEPSPHHLALTVDPTNTKTIDTMPEPQPSSFLPKSVGSILYHPVPSQFAWLTPYEQWQPKPGITPVHISRDSSTICLELLAICELEGPILGSYLFREHYKATGGSSLSPGNEKAYQRWAGVLVSEGKLQRRDLLGRHNFESMEYVIANSSNSAPRVPGPRSLYEIPPSEIALSFNLHLATLKSNESNESNEAICRRVLNGLGFTSLTVKAKEYLESIRDC